MEDYYPKAYREVYEIIKYLPKQDFDKIPSEMINMLEVNMDQNYKYDLDKTKPFEEQIMLKETRNILAVFYKNYWASEQEKERIQRKIRNDKEASEKAKKERYSSDIIFNRNEKNKMEPVSLVETKKETLYSKIFSFIKNLIKRKK